MLGPKIYRDIPRVEQSLLAELRGVSVADIQDSLAEPGLRASSLMTTRMKALLPDLRIIGHAVTAYCPPGDNLMMHTALFLTKPGDVLVVSNGGIEVGALWGDNATAQAEKKGVVGVVIDGPVRDTTTIRAAKFPVWATSISVTSPTKNRLGSVNTPVLCAGVFVYPGDIIIADGDGVIAIRPYLLADLIVRTRQQATKEKDMKSTIAGGETVFETLRMDETIAQLGGKISDSKWQE